LLKIFNVRQKIATSWPACLSSARRRQQNTMQ